MLAMSIRTVIERGSKGKRVVAFALDYPGWSCGRTSPERHAAIHVLDHAWEMEDKDLSGEAA